MIERRCDSHFLWVRGCGALREIWDDFFSPLTDNWWNWVAYMRAESCAEMCW